MSLKTKRICRLGSVRFTHFRKWDATRYIHYMRNSTTIWPSHFSFRIKLISVMKVAPEKHSVVNSFRNVCLQEVYDGSELQKIVIFPFLWFQQIMIWLNHKYFLHCMYEMIRRIFFPASGFVPKRHKRSTTFLQNCQTWKISVPS